MGLSIILLIAAPFFILLIWGIATSNRLTRLRNEAENAFASVDAYLKKRFDLIPNLVAAVQKYMGHEKSVLTEITALRSRAMEPGLSNDEAIDINNKMNSALRSVNVAVENYPDLNRTPTSCSCRHHLMRWKSRFRQPEGHITLLYWHLTTVYSCFHRA